MKQEAGKPTGGKRRERRGPEWSPHYIVCIEWGGRSDDFVPGPSQSCQWGPDWKYYKVCTLLRTVCVSLVVSDLIFLIMNCIVLCFYSEPLLQEAGPHFNQSGLVLGQSQG